MRMEINGADLVFIGIFGYSAAVSSPLWALAIPVIILNWFFKVTWEGQKGFVWSKR